MYFVYIRLWRGRMIAYGSRNNHRFFKAHDHKHNDSHTGETQYSYSMEYDIIYANKIGETQRCIHRALVYRLGRCSLRLCTTFASEILTYLLPACDDSPLSGFLAAPPHPCVRKLGTCPTNPVCCTNFVYNRVCLVVIIR